MNHCYINNIELILSELFNDSNIDLTSSIFVEDDSFFCNYDELYNQQYIENIKKYIESKGFHCIITRSKIENFKGKYISKVYHVKSSNKFYVLCEGDKMFSNDLTIENSIQSSFIYIYKGI